MVVLYGLVGGDSDKTIELTNLSLLSTAAEEVTVIVCHFDPDGNISEQKSFCKASQTFMVGRGSSGATLVIHDFISSDATLRCDRLNTSVLQAL